MLSESVLSRFPTEVSTMLECGLLVDYPVPLKETEKDAARRVALNWSVFDLGRKAKRRRNVAELYEAASEPGRAKLANTRRFLNEMENRGLESALALAGFPVFGDPKQGLGPE